MILGCGITGWIALQAFINMAVNTATLPFSGLTLPFVSYGGSSLVACMAGIGVLLSISRYGSQAAAAPANARPAQNAVANGATYATLGFGWRNWRARLSSLGRPRRVAARRRAAGNPALSGGAYNVKAINTPRSATLNRRVVRAKRTIARRTGAGRKPRPAHGPAGRRPSSGTRQVPRRR
jgi:hypothetical protein